MTERRDLEDGGDDSCVSTIKDGAHETMLPLPGRAVHHGGMSRRLPGLCWPMPPIRFVAATNACSLPCAEVRSSLCHRWAMAQWTG